MTLLMHVPTWPLAPFLCMNAHAEPIVALGPYEAQQIGSLRSCDQQQQQLGPISLAFSSTSHFLSKGPTLQSSVPLSGMADFPGTYASMLLQDTLVVS